MRANQRKSGARHSDQDIRKAPQQWVLHAFQVFKHHQMRPATVFKLLPRGLVTRGNYPLDHGALERQGVIADQSGSRNQQGSHCRCRREQRTGHIRRICDSEQLLKQQGEHCHV
ncbi:hypothetical protein [Streptomyces goshikiensis]|uniref:hypothetical protein n=1 Tax=Streptomyces goshikiensis TaxID=1942 RepID=UPI002F9132E7